MSESNSQTPSEHVPPTAQTNTSDTPVTSVTTQMDNLSVQPQSQPQQTNQNAEDSSSSDSDEGWSSKWSSSWSFKKKPEGDPKKMWEDEEKLSLEERRKRYRCYKYKTADDILTWHEITQKYKLQPVDSEYTGIEELNKKIGWIHGDITTLEIDAIVNAANESCLGGGGVDGAIHNAAGDQLYEECRTLHGCPTGDTKITRGYNLPAKFILHTVGPVGERPSLLTSCYETCLELVAKHNIRTVAFCGISTGIFGYPLVSATKIALKVVRKWLEVPGNKDKVDKIIFCTFLEKEKDCYLKLFQVYFPVPKLEEKKEDNNNNSNQEVSKEEVKEQNNKQEATSEKPTETKKESETESTTKEVVSESKPTETTNKEPETKLD